MDKTDSIDPFNQLNEEDQKAAIDVAIAAILIGMRIPSTGKPLYDYVATEFAVSRTLPSNLAKYALRSLGRSLTAQDWELIITRHGETLTTQFRSQPIQKSDGHDELDRA